MKPIYVFCFAVFLLYGCAGEKDVLGYNGSHYEHVNSRLYKRDTVCNTVDICINLIFRLVRRNWKLPIVENLDNLTATVSVKLNDAMQISEVELVESSGNLKFDRSVLKAIYAVRQFPELKGLSKADYQKHFKKLLLKFDP